MFNSESYEEADVGLHSSPQHQDSRVPGQDSSHEFVQQLSPEVALRQAALDVGEDDQRQDEIDDIVEEALTDGENQSDSSIGFGTAETSSLFVRNAVIFSSSPAIPRLISGSLLRSIFRQT